MKEEKNLKTPIFASERVLEPSPADVIPQYPTDPQVAYQIVKEETYPQTNPMLNLASFISFVA